VTVTDLELIEAAGWQRPRRRSPSRHRADSYSDHAGGRRRAAMKLVQIVIATLGVIVMLAMLASMLAAIVDSANRRDACAAEGGVWTHVPLASEYMPGGFPLYVCKKP
jgi:hypothetical protein